MPDVAERAERKVKGAARDAAPWLERLARLGFLSRGVVYVLIAWLAARAAFLRRHPSGTRGAMHALLNAPTGHVVVALLAVGLIGYATWRFMDAILDPERKGTDVKGLAKRGAYFSTAVIYVGMAATAVRLAIGSHAAGDSDSAGRWTAPVMEHPLGRWAVVAVGVGVGVYGAWLLFRSVAKEPEKRLDLSGCSPAMRRTFEVLGRAGIASRAIVFGVIGAWLVKAALDYRPQEARMPAGALESVREQPHGEWLLIVVAVGLAAFGLFEIVKARYRVIATPR